MEICIIDRKSSLIEEKKHTNMLWVASLVGEKVRTSGGNSYLLYILVNWDLMPEKMKFELSCLIMEKEIGMESEEVAGFKFAYEAIHRNKTTRNKTKDDIVKLKKAEQVLIDSYGIVKTYLEDICKEGNVFELINSINIKTQDEKKPIMCYPIEISFVADKLDETMNYITKCIGTAASIPFIVGDSIKKILRGRDINNKRIYLFPSNFIYDPIFEITAPETLNSAQLSIARNELSSLFRNYFNELSKVNEGLKEIEFKRRNYKKAIKVLAAETKELKPLLQKAIDSCEILKQLETEGEVLQKYQVCIGISSFRNLLVYYNNTGILPKEVAFYVMEEIGKKV